MHSLVVEMLFIITDKGSIMNTFTCYLIIKLSTFVTFECSHFICIVFVSSVNVIIKKIGLFSINKSSAVTT